MITQPDQTAHLYALMRVTMMPTTTLAGMSETRMGNKSVPVRIGEACLTARK
jgi:hypothetical protein